MDIAHKKALRRFHGLCREIGLNEDEKRAVIHGCGAESSSDIPTNELCAICSRLQAKSNPKIAEMSALRRRVMASIGGWLKAAGYKSNAEIIKGIACRASGYDNFNRIPAARLHNLYHNFRNKQIDKLAAERLMGSLLAHQAEVGVGDKNIN